MSLIDDIRKDREAGTPGPWDVMFREFDGSSLISMGDVKTGPHMQANMPFYADRPRDRNDARRIARVPELEAALLAAEELVSAAMTLCIKANNPMKAGRKWATYDVDVMTDAVSHYKSAHAAYRAATSVS